MSGPPTIRRQKQSGITWVDLENPDTAVLAKLEHDYHLHPVHVRESLQKVQHTQVERERNYLFLVLHAPVGTRGNKLSVHQLGIFLGRDFLITIRNGDIPAVQQLFDSSLGNTDAAHAAFVRGAGYLLYTLINNLLDDMSKLADAITSELDGLEGVVFGDTTSDAVRIGRVRQAIVRMRRVIGPKRYILQDLADQVHSFGDDSLTKYYSNNTKKVNRLWETIDEAKETVEIYKDADFTTSTEQTNKILAVLTIIFTLSIPTTLVGTIYGMNIPLPGGLTTGPWTLFGRYTTLGVTVIASLLVAAGMYVYFRKKHWF